MDELTKVMWKYVLFHLLLTLFLNSRVIQGKIVLIDRIVATVTSKVPAEKSFEVITLWEVEARSKIELIRRYGPKGFWAVPGKLLERIIIDRFIDEAVVIMELARLGGIEVDRGELRESYNKLIKKAGGEEMWRRGVEECGISEQKVKSWLEREIIVEKYISAQMFFSNQEHEDRGDIHSQQKDSFMRDFIDEVRDRYRIEVFFDDSEESY